MKRISAVVFPDIVPAPQVLIPLVPVFQPVVYCQAVENDDSVKALGSLCEEMSRLSFLLLHAPAPLNENRDRFLHLVRDLRQRKDEYAAQLSHVSLAGISSGSQESNEQQSAILSSLMSDHENGAKKNETKEKLLWQARLVLKLGEQYDADQQKIAEDIQNLQSKEHNLFADLVQDANSPFSLTGKLTSLRTDSARMKHLKLKAWARLFAFGANPLAETRIFITHDQDAMDRLCEEHERISGSRPEEFCRLLLPAVCPDEGRFLEQVQGIVHKEAAQLESLADLFMSPSYVSGSPGHSYNDIIDAYFPSQDHGRCQLFLYSFPGVRARQLFLDSFGHDDDNLQADMPDAAQQNIVIGLLSDL